MAQRIKKRKLKQRQKKQLAALTMVIMAAGLAAIMLLTPLFDITQITVQGNSVVDDAAIIRSGGIIKGINIFSVSLGKAEKAVEEMGYIDNAKIRRRLPGKIEITVVEAAGVARVPAKSGFIIITADGRAIDKIDASTDKEENNFSKTPVIKGLKNVKYKIGKPITCDDEQKLNDVLLLLSSFSKSGQIFNMQRIDASNIANISFTYNGGKLEVLVGTTEKLDYKMECFGPILEQIGDDPSGYIDLERLTYRKKQE